MQSGLTNAPDQREGIAFLPSQQPWRLRIQSTFPNTDGEHASAWSTLMLSRDSESPCLEILIDIVGDGGHQLAPVLGAGQEPRILRIGNKSHLDQHRRYVKPAQHGEVRLPVGPPQETDAALPERYDQRLGELR